LALSDQQLSNQGILLSIFNAYIALRNYRRLKSVTFYASSAIKMRNFSTLLRENA